MKLLLDTNIIVDVLSRRANYEESLNVLRCCEARKAEGLVTTATIMDVMYILRRHMDANKMKDAVRTMLTIAKVVEIRESDIHAAFDSGTSDFEDAVQASCAKRNRADYIVTRSKKDFVKAPVPALLPAEVLSLLG